ncbi:DegT/DnrJ/EryC1/StrS family aminotransferase [Flavobacterium sp. NRK F10]|uniref:DegT/DnrJ/EryC1/StrS family aminotransferase n=1 Tax=Flavobacterium sp. NRK F10 TaxID=2954931 RepID=UPI00209150B5|nr:DegT/DnrJ/EryC1/StrS family aminotransferase [Flavobacterium sp. NRK F10]MCO6174195.1 DegT/DnrJ/EryC1/StrS family aminotransferase [Flavobacterium sp. NRK F10]
MINVTQTYLPPIEEYRSFLQRAWDAKWLTNRGQLVKELEEKLIAYLGVDNLTLTTNGTLPLQIAIKAMELKGEIITTPFSYVATTSSIVWENCKPVFVDIHPDYLTIDETLIEAAITNDTSAILATHVFGNPCNVEVIEQIARKHNLKVIYDAAHCFGVNYKGKSIFDYGDVSTCSFHATKIFHTGEGGCWITNNKELHHKIYYHHNFGHKNQEEFLGLGTNAKMSELQAAMGLAVFGHLDEIFKGRKEVVGFYDEYLKDSPVRKLKIRENTEWNYHYYPVIFDTEEELLKVKEILNSQQIFPRRYFYPSLNTLPYLKEQKCEISESISKRILCLPLYVGLDKRIVENISKTISNG